MKRNQQNHNVRAGGNLESGSNFKREFKMQSSAKGKKILQVVMVLLLLVLLFGTQAHAASQTLFTTQVPAQVSQSDGAGVNYELGTVFQSTTAGQITAIRFWKDVNEKGTHMGHVWSASGQLLASVVFTNETASGWQQQVLSSPLAITANVIYVVSVNTTKTFYVTTIDGMATQVVNGTLSSVVGKNGLYAGAGNFPRKSWNASNYFRDVVFTSSSSSATTTVAPSITSQPVSQTITSGQSASFNVAATGTSPMKFQWMKNGAAIRGATLSSYTTPTEMSSASNTQFSVAVSNGAGSATSNPAMLVVNASASVAPTATAPLITTQPSSQTVTVGQTATFSVAATGTSPMTYQWQKNGSSISGASSSTYTTPATASSDSGAKFTVVLSNSAGSATSAAATLTVNSATTAPSITSQPSSKSVIAGQTATFSVAASGTGPLTYQWMKNSAPISGATSSSYTTPAETTTDNNAQFAVTVSNSIGTATSNSASLTVTAGTLLLNSSASSLSFGSVNESSSSSQTVTLTNAGNSNVTISGVSVSGAGFNASGVSTGLILTPGQTTTLTATFTPASTASVTGTISVASNATNSPDTISVSGTGVAVVNHSASLSWTPSTSTVIGYNTYSSTTSGGPYTKLTSTPTAGTSYTDTTVQAGLTYYYVVTSVDSSNTESGYSSQVTAVIP